LRRWSNTHTGKKLIKFLMHVATRRIFHLDTWTITCQPAEQGAACSEQQIVCFASAGFDASIAWRFHHMRENSPSESGNSVVANKVTPTSDGQTYVCGAAIRVQAAE
jgi:hypothetical protein